MSKGILRRLTLVVTVAAALFLSGCGGYSDQFRDGAEQNDDLTMLAFRDGIG